MKLEWMSVMDAGIRCNGRTQDGLVTLSSQSRLQKIQDIIRNPANVPTCLMDIDLRTAIFPAADIPSFHQTLIRTYQSPMVHLKQLQTIGKQSALRGPHCTISTLSHRWIIRSAVKNIKIPIRPAPSSEICVASIWALHVPRRLTKAAAENLLKPLTILKAISSLGGSLTLLPSEAIQPGQEIVSSIIRLTCTVIFGTVWSHLKHKNSP
ncbi:hypothetical protein SISNIDRAFT_469662 [Sistotremastrum niveocremeum HHB9708]|uniref:Uncharacterized protein n=1 Tax=Sistotremastrum niveocremeum HHB9708 TaxID=1314777 RepID=A0A164PQX4_9AGAM|nr:hypothetical protein SISNIDRAFT_469662 [Sistotremastrum niveocremeum HHB9708]